MKKKKEEEVQRMRTMEQEEANMEVFVCAPGSSRFSNAVFPGGSVVRDVLDRFVQQQVSVHISLRPENYPGSNVSVLFADVLMSRLVALANRLAV